METHALWTKITYTPILLYNLEAKTLNINMTPSETKKLKD